MLFTIPPKPTPRERKLGKKAWKKYLRHDRPGQSRPRSRRARGVIDRALGRYSNWVWGESLVRETNRVDQLFDSSLVGSDPDSLFLVIE